MTNPIFKLTAPSADDLANFHRDGCVVLPDVFTDESLAGLTDEILKNLENVLFQIFNLTPKHF